jgi:hypothetical protein
MILATHAIISSSQIIYDTDALAFITAANITDTTQKNAINQLVLDLKSYGVWTKMKALYPFVGGTAITHKYNLKDPRDLDAAYRLQFVNGWTHSSTGAKPNGIDAYADTKLNENSVMTLGNEHISTYLRTNVQGLFADIGVWLNAYNYGTQILPRFTYPFTYDTYIGYVNDTSNSYFSNNDSRGFFISNRISTTHLKLQKNSTINTFSVNSINKINANFWIGARNIDINGHLYSPREQAFASIGDGLTDTEATNFYTAVQKYQTTLVRQV